MSYKLGVIDSDTGRFTELSLLNIDVSALSGSAMVCVDDSSELRLLSKALADSLEANAMASKDPNMLPMFMVDVSNVYIGDSDTYPIASSNYGLAAMGDCVTTNGSGWVTVTDITGSGKLFCVYSSSGGSATATLAIELTIDGTVYTATIAKNNLYSSGSILMIGGDCVGQVNGAITPDRVYRTSKARIQSPGHILSQGGGFVKFNQSLKVRTYQSAVTYGNYTGCVYQIDKFS